jgi:competence protein ComFC
MNFLEGMLNLGADLIGLVFPIACLSCGKEDVYICALCLAQLPRLEHQICVRCQNPSPFGKTHPACSSRNFPDGSISALQYKNRVVGKVIETFKYSFVSDLSRPLTQLIVESILNQGLEGYFKNFVVIPVPLHFKRHNWRGFNQAEILAQTLSTSLNWAMDADVVVRTRHTKPQVKLTALQRKMNVQKAFAIKGSQVPIKILLVDDVLTSGATINELAKLLKKSGAQEVWSVTVAHG